jgi:hypothetical protein
MSLPPLPDQNSSDQPAPLRRFLTRAEAATLIGMVLIVFSLFLTWERIPLPSGGVPPPGSALLVSGGLTRTGFATSARIPLTVCAVVCSLLLLWTPTARTRLPLAVVQGACGIACLVMALTRLALLPGVLVGLVGGALLTFGAIDRYTAFEPSAESQET